MVNQTFPIIYQNERFLVDPELLYTSSQKFRDLINENQISINNSCLKITYHLFTIRNVSNFLKICQNQETDIQNSELKEICLLAKMFQAEQIYNTAFNFIQTEIDNNYFIPTDQLKEINEKQNLLIETETKEMHKAFQWDLNELEFDDSSEEVESNNNNNILDSKQKKDPVCYQIKIENSLFKCHRFCFIKDGKVIYTAKQKYDEICIGEGENCHFKDNEEANVAKIIRDLRGYNVVNTSNQEFKIKYLKDGEKFLVKTTFDHPKGKQNWVPKEKNCDELLKGEFGHKVLKSTKNVILQNQKCHPTFILRKTTRKIYEAECHQEADPIIMFAIALSQIIGPIAM